MISGTYTTNYDSATNAFILDKIILQQNPFKKIYIKITTNAIPIPVFDDSGYLISVNDSYQLSMVVTMRDCNIFTQTLNASNNYFSFLARHYWRGLY